MSLLNKLFVVLCSFISIVGAQNETVNWVFGNQASVTFTGGTAAYVSGSTYNNSTSNACQSNSNGNLLFFSDGATVYNSLNTVMANGSGLNGAGVAMAVKKPGSSNLHYVFYPGQGAVFQYSLIDMNLAGGAGSVIARDQTIGSGSSFGLSGTYHCNGTDIWVIVYVANTGNFVSYLLTSAGITTSVVSSSGYLNANFHQFTTDPSGSKISVAMTTASTASVLIHNFNRSTGSVSTGTALYTAGVAIIDSEFSADGSKLYASVPLAGIIQFNLCAGSTSAVAASAYQLSASQVWGLQRAPDKRIYCSVWGSSTLACIGNPNASGAACNFSIAAVSVSPASCYGNLPNTFPGYLNFSKSGLTYSINTSLSCRTVSFTLPAAGCSALGNFVNPYWNFGDPGSGVANTSGSLNPSHTFSATGSYTVKFTSQQACADTFYQVVNIVVPTVTISGIQSMCRGNSATLTASGGANYVWSNSVTGASVVVTPTASTVYSLSSNSAQLDCGAVATHTLLVTGGITISASADTVCSGKQCTLSAQGAISYSWSQSGNGSPIVVNPVTSTVVTVSGPTGSCVSIASVNIAVLPNPTISIVASSNSVCPGSPAVLTASGAQSYTWGGATVSSSILIYPSATGIYTVSGQANNCSATASLSIFVYALPVITVASADTAVCKNNSVALSAAGGISYTLNFVPFQTTITVVPQSSVIYTVTGSDQNACVNSNTIAIRVRLQPLVTILADKKIICAGDSARLVAAGAATYVWSNNLPGNSVAVSPTTNQSYTVTGVDSFGCISSATITIQVSRCLKLMDREEQQEIYTVAPNPFSNRFSVLFNSSQSVDLTIADLSGKLMFEEKNYLSGKPIEFNANNSIFIVTVTNSAGLRKVFKLIAE